MRRVAGMPLEAEEAIAYLRQQGYEVHLYQRHLHDEYMASGDPGRASFFTAGREYWCVDLVRDGATAWPRAGVGETDVDAIVRAHHWFTR